MMTSNRMMENFWSLLKRGLHGTYVSVEPFHLFRYLDEQMFRFNNRKALLLLKTRCRQPMSVRAPSFAGACCHLRP